MHNILITNAKYLRVDGTNTSINTTIDGHVLSVPIDPENRHYAEIMRQVEAGELVIHEATP